MWLPPQQTSPPCLTRGTCPPSEVLVTGLSCLWKCDGVCCVPPNIIPRCAVHSCSVWYLLGRDFSAAGGPLPTPLLGRQSPHSRGLQPCRIKKSGSVGELILLCLPPSSSPDPGRTLRRMNLKSQCQLCRANGIPRGQGLDMSMPTQHRHPRLLSQEACAPKQTAPPVFPGKQRYWSGLLPMVTTPNLPDYQTDVSSRAPAF